MTEEERQQEALRKDRSLLTVTLIMLVSFIAVTSFNILYTNYINAKTNRNWCELMVGLDNRQQRIKTKDPDALKFIKDVHDLRRKLDCPQDNHQ